jgi:hypothetical protein
LDIDLFRIPDPLGEHGLGKSRRRRLFAADGRVPAVYSSPTIYQP